MWMHTYAIRRRYLSCRTLFLFLHTYPAAVEMFWGWSQMAGWCQKNPGDDVGVSRQLEGTLTGGLAELVALVLIRGDGWCRCLLRFHNGCRCRWVGRWDDRKGPETEYQMRQWDEEEKQQSRPADETTAELPLPQNTLLLFVFRKSKLMGGSALILVKHNTVLCLKYVN